MQSLDFECGVSAVSISIVKFILHASVNPIIIMFIHENL